VIVGNAFWEAVGGKLADRWVAVGGPALAFWLGGVLAFMLGRGGFRALQPFSDWLARRSSPLQAAVLVAVLFLVAASGLVVSRLDTPALDGQATAEQREEHMRIDRQLRRLPSKPRVQPTRVGNTLRAAETRPIDKYGLDAAAVWPHLWLLLPQATRDELAAARRSLDTAVEACIWGLLFLAFTPWTLWALPAGLAVSSAAALVWVPARAEVFADLVEATFDLYHQLLYRQLRWPPPADPADDRVNGRRMTTYLMRGLSGNSPAFTCADPAPADCARTGTEVTS
jgi:hypothetical protein